MTDLSSGHLDPAASIKDSPACIVGHRAVREFHHLPVVVYSGGARAGRVLGHRAVVQGQRAMIVDATAMLSGGVSRDRALGQGQCPKVDDAGPRAVRLAIAQSKVREI